MDTTGTLIFCDTETTSLRPDRRVWELGCYVRRAAAPVQVVHRLVFAEDLDLGNADPASLDIGRYWYRHPQGRGDMQFPTGAELMAEETMLYEFGQLSRGATLVGNVVNFDAEVLAARMRAAGLCPAWHYHLIDVEALAAGWLRRDAETCPDPDRAGWLLDVAEPPWDSAELSAALGLDTDGYERHTALGDARWAMDMYDKVMGNRIQHRPRDHAEAPA